MMPSTLVFDVGSTLIHPNFLMLRDWLNDRAGIGADVCTVEYAFRRALAGDIFAADNDEEAQARQFFSLTGAPSVTETAWSGWWKEIVRAGGAGSWLYTALDPHAHSTLHALRDRGCYLIAASNSDGTLRAELAAFGLLELFNDTYDSSDIGVEKPSPAFYQHVLAGVRDARAVHLGDDLVKDVLGPLGAGFHRAVLYDPANVYTGAPSSMRISQLSDLASALERNA